METISHLAVGPMSRTIIEAVYSYSHKYQTPLMLIASKNQVDWASGYVLTTKEIGRYANQLRKVYSQAVVYLCRDHCGPGFNGNNTLKDVYSTIDEDISSGFNLIHVDLCHLRGGYDRILTTSRKVIEYILRNSPLTLIEIGTDENNGKYYKDLKKIEQEMQFFTSISQPYFYVTQTGSLIREDEQVGSFERSYVQKIRSLATKYKLHLKEHNADYLTLREISKRRGLIDAVNIAPQLGVIQTQLTLQKALLYGLNTKPFLEKAYQSHKWKKWLYKNTAVNKHLCSVIAGHYVFNSLEYLQLFDELNKCEDFTGEIEGAMYSLFKLYHNLKSGITSS